MGPCRAWRRAWAFVTLTSSARSVSTRRSCSGCGGSTSTCPDRRFSLCVPGFPIRLNAVAPGFRGLAVETTAQMHGLLAMAGLRRGNVAPNAPRALAAGLLGLQNLAKKGEVAIVSEMLFQFFRGLRMAFDLFRQHPGQQFELVAQVFDPLAPIMKVIGPG